MKEKLVFCVLKLKMNINKLTDQELVKKSIQNVDFFGYLMDRYENKLSHFIMRISSFNKEESEDILQEVFLKAWKNLNDFSEDMQFSNWIFSIARNQTISEYRKAKSRGIKSKTELEIEDFMNIASKIDLEKEISKKIDQEKIHEILSLMPIHYKEVLVLKFLEEKSTSEISDILKKPENTISTLIHRAKEEFRKITNKFNFF